jgi:hypothetical protein
VRGGRSATAALWPRSDAKAAKRLTAGRERGSRRIPRDGSKSSIRGRDEKVGLDELTLCATKDGDADAEEVGWSKEKKND